MTEIEQIYRTYFNAVFRYIRRLSGDEHIAAEITSEAFFKAMRSLGRFRGECDIRVWLCQIAKNCYYSYLKRAGRTESLEDVDPLSLLAEEKSVEEQFIQREEAAEMKALLRELPEPYKEVFMDRVFGEMSFREIAQHFGKTENWACVTYHRARKKLKAKAEDERNEE